MEDHEVHWSKGLLPGILAGGQVPCHAASLGSLSHSHACPQRVFTGVDYYGLGLLSALLTYWCKDRGLAETWVGLINTVQHTCVVLFGPSIELMSKTHFAR